MKMITLKSINLVIGMLMIFSADYVQGQSQPVKIMGIRSSKGNIIINVFKDQADYDKEIPYKKFSFDKKGLDKGVMTVKFNMEAGIYGITLLDDENANGKIDKNLIRVPKEGFGFSNYYMEKLKKPSFDDFKVDLRKQPRVEIKVKYL
ncbi:DUF2141 domain-containing protein [Mucilaginibacter sp. PAMB04274]|uniref:DUF2141 domain-containing protein n=1 Tax=Mucilaginibacter sp. PAMB04274 TaxID=3138568 RepID=UPI0031F63AB3